MILRNWLNERHMSKDDRKFRQGFNYAASELLWFPDDYDGLVREKLLAESENCLEYGPFERGMKKALHVWTERIYVKAA